MSFKVIDGGGKKGRDLILAEQEFSRALRESVANLLRVMRGAGRPDDLLYQLNGVLKAATQILDLTGQLPVEIMTTILHGRSETQNIWERRQRGEIDDATIDQWEKDGTISRKYAEEVIHAGVLQVIASQLVRQDLQLRAGTKEFNDGIRRLAEAEEKSQKYWRAIHGVGTMKPRRATSKRQTRKSDEPPVL
jgi:hypothetical protein